MNASGPEPAPHRLKGPPPDGAQDRRSQGEGGQQDGRRGGIGPRLPAAHQQGSRQVVVQDEQHQERQNPQPELQHVRKGGRTPGPRDALEQLDERADHEHARPDEQVEPVLVSFFGGETFHFHKNKQ